MTTIIKIRRDTASNWTLTNPILAAGEPGLETDTLAIKYGDGVTLWNDLPYAVVEHALTADEATHAITSDTANLALSLTTDIANISISGGTDGYVLSTDGNGVLTWKIDSTNNMGNIVIDGDNIGSSNDIVNIVGNNYAELQSNDSYIWVDADGAYVENAGGMWTFNYDGTTQFPNNAILTSLSSDGQYIVTKNFDVTSLITGATNVNMSGNQTIVIDKTATPDINLVQSSWVVQYNNRSYEISSVADDTPDTGLFSIILSSLPSGAPLIPTDAVIDVGPVVFNEWQFAQNGTTTVPGTITTNQNDYLSINGSHTNGISLNSDNYSQLMWVPDITDLPNVNPDTGGPTHTWAYADGEGFWIEGKNTSPVDYSWNFTPDGKLSMPLATKLNSGGIGVTNSAEFGTEIVYGPGNYDWWDLSKKNANVIVTGGDLALGIYVDPSVGLGAYPIFSNFTIGGTDLAMFSTYVDIISYETGNTGVGVANSDATLTNRIGADKNGIAIYDNGQVYTNGNLVVALNGLSFLGGDNVDVAVDRNLNLIWFRKNTGFWNDDDVADPTTGTGGIDISGISGTLYPVGIVGGSDSNPEQSGSLTIHTEAPNGTPTGFTFLFPTQPQNDVIRDSTIYMSSGTGEGRVITDSFGNSLAYFGTENVGLPGFAGLIASDPEVTSMYQIGTNQDTNILIGATTGNGEIRSTDYRTGLGVLNAGMTINGIYSDTNNTVVSGGDAENNSAMSLDTNGIMVTNTIYPKNPQTTDLGKFDNHFDTIYVNSTNSKSDYIVQTGQDYSYWYSVYGDFSHNDLSNQDFSSGVVYDDQGNLYVMGQEYITNERFDTIALKYDPEGNLIWRKRWVTPDGGGPCGSYNQELSYSGGRIYWISIGANDTSYVGSMDLDGVITSPATKIDNFVARDLIAINTDVYICGQKATPSDGYFPAVLKVDTALNEVVWCTSYTGYNGVFECIVVDNTPAYLYLTGTMNDGADYAVVSKMGIDGTPYDTSKLNSTDSSSQIGKSIGYYNDGAIYVTYSSQNGIILTKLTSDFIKPVWNISYAINYGVNCFFNGMDLTIDYQGYVIITGTYSTGGSVQFLVLRYNQDGKLIYQRELGTNTGSDQGSGSFIADSTRMAAIRGNQLAITGYTTTDPVASNEWNNKFITAQLPINGTGTGDYEGFYWYQTYFPSSTPFSTDYVDFPQLGSDILPTFSSNNGFIPDTVLVNPDYHPYTYKISASMNNTWVFNSDNALHVPGGGFIYGPGNNGSIEIYSGQDLNGQINQARLATWSENHSMRMYDSEPGTNDGGIEFNTPNSWWKLTGDLSPLVGSIYYGNRARVSVTQKQGLANYDVAFNEMEILPNETSTIYITRDSQVTSGRFTAHVETGIDNTNSPWDNCDVMTCEITLASRRVNGKNSLPIISVYGIVHTSDNPLATFDAGIYPDGTYTNVSQKSTTGNGINVAFTITTHPWGGISASISNGGSGYFVGDLITLSGADVGGFDETNDIVIHVTDVNNGEVTNQYVQSGTTYAGRVYLTCTPAVDVQNNCFVKISGTESGSGAVESWC